MAIFRLCLATILNSCEMHRKQYKLNQTSNLYYCFRLSNGTGWSHIDRISLKSVSSTCLARFLTQTFFLSDFILALDVNDGRAANEPIRVEFWPNRAESRYNFIEFELELELDELTISSSSSKKIKNNYFIFKKINKIIFFLNK